MPKLGSSLSEPPLASGGVALRFTNCDVFKIANLFAKFYL